MLLDFTGLKATMECNMCNMNHVLDKSYSPDWIQSPRRKPGRLEAPGSAPALYLHAAAAQEDTHVSKDTQKVKVKPHPVQSRCKTSTEK